MYLLYNIQTSKTFFKNVRNMMKKLTILGNF